MIGDVVEEAVLAVHLRVEREPRMRRDELQRVVLEAFSARELRRPRVLRDRRPLLAVRIETLQALALELDLAGLSLQAVQVPLRVIRRQRHRLRHVLLPALVEPVPRERRALLLFLGGDHEVTLADELFPRDVLRQIRALELPLDPAELIRALGEIDREIEPLADLLEDPKV